VLGEGSAAYETQSARHECLSVRCLLAESECRSHIGGQPVLGISTAVHILQSENFFDAQILVTLPSQS